MRQERWSRIERGTARYATVSVGEPSPGIEAVVVSYELFAELMERAGMRLCDAKVIPDGPLMMTEREGRI